MKIFKKSSCYLILAGVLVLPAVAYAQTVTQFIAQRVLPVITAATGVVIALALLYFLWGMALLILNAADPAKKAEGKQKMLWGIIALFVMVSLIGILAILKNQFFPGGTDFITIEPLGGCDISQGPCP